LFNAQRRKRQGRAVLAFLVRDIAKHPDTFVIEMPTVLLERSMLLTEGTEVDLDVEIAGDVSI
jgi:hypothetical protein